MPPSKTRLQAMVDIDVNQYWEAKWREECRRCLDAKRKTPSWSEFVNRLLHRLMVEDMKT